MRPYSHCSGIYEIRSKRTGKVYIGSSVSLTNRWWHHRHALRNGTHHNAYLQKAWNKHGEANFDFRVLQLCRRSELLKMEQAWIDRTQCARRRHGFNICPEAISPGDTRSKTWKGFFDPSGKAVIIRNLQDFCRRHRLNPASMHRLAKGGSKLKSCKGWTHKNSVRQRDYVKTYDGFIDPQGRQVETIKNLASFCRDKGLDNTHMLAVMRGRICSHRGWTHISGRKRNLKTHAGFINPVGQSVSITNLAQFCRTHSLSVVRMHNLINGIRKSHKGWTWRKIND